MKLIRKLLALAAIILAVWAGLLYFDPERAAEIKAAIREDASTYTNAVYDLAGDLDARGIHFLVKLLPERESSPAFPEHASADTDPSGSDTGEPSDYVAIDGVGSLDNAADQTPESPASPEPDSGAYTFDPQYLIFYSFLSEKEQTVYRQLYAGACSVCGEIAPAEELTVDELTETVSALYSDCPELFWLDTGFSYKYLETGICTSVTLEYNDLANDLVSAKAAFDASAEAILGPARTLPTVYEKECFVHDTLIAMIDYNLDSGYNQSAYSALVGHSTVCAGYAKAFQYLMDQLGIPTYLCSGYSEGDHAWNIILLDDGCYYNVDVTWDDNEYDSRLFFDLTDVEIGTDHTRNEESMQLPACNGTTY